MGITIRQLTLDELQYLRWGLSWLFNEESSLNESEKKEVNSLYNKLSSASYVEYERK